MPALKRIHVIGASGCGTSTLGRALAARFSLPFTDSDDVYWDTTDPPFTVVNPNKEARLTAALRGKEWVLAGSVMPWGDFLRGQFTHLIFLTLDPAPRLERLRARERARLGARVEEGGDLHRRHLDFLDWAGQYDEGRLEGRCRALHEKWLRDLPCPVLRLSGALPTADQVAAFERFLAPLSFRVDCAPDAGPVVDPFYARLGRSARARAGDLFFVATGADGATLGCVRYCVEEGTPLLRSMLVDETARRKGVGKKLLDAFAGRVAGEPDLYCVPFSHLESFYAQIGFQTVNEGPPFLLERLRRYREEGLPVILMRRA